MVAYKRLREVFTYGQEKEPPGGSVQRDFGRPLPSLGMDIKPWTFYPPESSEALKA